MAQYNNPGLNPYLYTGGAVKFDTQRLGQLLYQEQKQREAMRQKEAAAIDDEFSKNVSKIRDVDVPDYTNLYNNYKNMKKQLLFNKQLQNNPQAYQQAQMETARTYSDLLKLGNASAAKREQLEDEHKNYYKNPDAYVDDYGSLMNAIQKTPLSKLGAVNVGIDEKGNPIVKDLSDIGVLHYKGIDYNPQKDLEAARGKKNEISIDEGPVDKTGLQNRYTTYESYGNSPEASKSAIMASMGKRDAYRYFTDLYKKTSPEEINKINEQFDAIPADQWKRMGLEKKEFKVNNPDSEADVVSTLIAKKLALDNIPKAIKTEFKTNEGVKLQSQRDWDLKMEGVKQANRERTARLQSSLQQQAKSGSIKGGTIDGYIKSIIESSKDKPPVPIHTTKGIQKTYEVPMTEDVVSSILNKNELEKLPEGGIRYIEGEGFQPIYFKKDKKGNILISNGKRVIDADKSTIRPMNQIKANMIKFYGNNLKNIPAEESLGLSDDEENTTPVQPNIPVKNKFKLTKGSLDNL